MILESAPYRFIRKGRSMRHVTAHISIWNKLGWIGLNKIENIIREERRKC